MPNIRVPSRQSVHDYLPLMDTGVKAYRNLCAIVRRVAPGFDPVQSNVGKTR
jgi:hypothetical protein